MREIIFSFHDEPPMTNYPVGRHLMVVANFDIVDIFCLKAKTDAPLVINRYGELPFPVAL